MRMISATYKKVKYCHENHEKQVEMDHRAANISRIEEEGAKVIEPFPRNLTETIECLF